MQKMGMKMAGCTCEGLWYRNTLSYIYLRTPSLRLLLESLLANPNLNNSVIGTRSLSVLHIHIKMLLKNHCPLPQENFQVKPNINQLYTFMRLGSHLGWTPSLDC